MVYDCFQFFNELDILKLRLHVMDPVVDRFVISEATETFSGKAKPLYYEENKEMFAEFADKIMCSRCRGRCKYFFSGGVGLCVGDIFGHRAHKYVAFLRDHCNRAL